MKRTYFHGTSADNLPAILANGFDIYTDKIWNPSENGVYFWSPEALTEAGECEEDYQDETAKQMACHSGQFAMTKSKDFRTVVFQVELDADTVEPDTSCQNMDGAVVTYKNVPASAIKAVFISPDLSTLKGYYIAIARRMDMSSLEFSPLENKVADIFDKSDLCIESDEFPLEPYEI